MAEKLEDLNLPVALVTRIIKESLPDFVNIAKEAKLALSRAASVFILYLSSHANKIVLENGKKTITNKEIMRAIRETDFGLFEEQLRYFSEQFRVYIIRKREAMLLKRRVKEFRLDDKPRDEGLEM